jgi:UDP-N-acetylmuramoyl-L-alanyl-D-glutamate--2,6-diaminopimelate ligase
VVLVISISTKIQAMKKLLKKFIPGWLLGTYHFKLALLGALVYGFPSRKIKVIGVTGTKGKSTVVMLAGRILQENITSPQPSPSKGEGEIHLFETEALRAEWPSPPLQKGGSRVGWVSSLTINDGKNEVMNPYHMTMPGRFFIQKMLAQMVKNGCQYALVEVTSEGIKQYRHKFINFSGAVFTNLAPEHLEAHGGFDNYRAAKEKLFVAAAKTPNSFGVYNLDDENVQNFLAYEIKNKYGYYFDPSTRLAGAGLVQGIKELSPERNEAESKAEEKFKISNVSLGANGSEFAINGVAFKTNLLGEFNVANCAAAVAVGQACGVSLEDAARALGKIQSIPGRLEIINERQNFTVVVDLAHTPDSFEKVFKLFKELKNSPHPNPLLEKEREAAGKIISVFGSAGGGRDKWKRPELGKIAAANSDKIIITNEDPYNEDPGQILSEIRSGISNFQFPVSNLYEILDRRAAIARGLSLAQPGDVVLILGKGTEQTYVENARKIDWDDRRVVREELKKLTASK